MDLSAGEIRGRAEGWIAYNVKIGESCEAQGLAQAPAPRAFGVYNQVGVVARILAGLKRGVEGADKGNFGLDGRQEAVRSLVGGTKMIVYLADAVGLSAQVITRV